MTDEEMCSMFPEIMHTSKDLEAAVAILHLAILDELPGEVGYGMTLSALTLDGKISRDMARAICRDLAAIGAAEHLTGLWSECTGLPVGSGYGITQKGMELREAIRRARWADHDTP